MSENRDSRLTADPIIRTYPDPNLSPVFRQWLADRARWRCRRCACPHSLLAHWEGCDGRFQAHQWVSPGQLHTE